ncbi:glycosyltransferase, partial [Candidatus Dependentiae bacterium]
TTNSNACAVTKTTWKSIPFDQAMKIGEETTDYLMWPVNAEVLLGHLKNLYEKNNLSVLPPSTQSRTPKIIHQICLEDQFPAAFVPYQQSWKDNHPEWQYKLWTKKDVAQLELRHRRLFDAQMTDAEKIDILKYEILYKFGGLYVDMNVESVKPFDILADNYDLFCALGPLDEDVLHVETAVLGSAPGHTIMKLCLDTLEENQDRSSPSLRTGVQHFSKAFGIKMYFGRNIALPTLYFYEATPQAESFCIHHRQIDWESNSGQIGEPIEQSRSLPLPEKKIIGLLTIENEPATVEPRLRALAQYTDAIVCLAEQAEEETLNNLEAVAKECGVKWIIKKADLHDTNLSPQNELLLIGRTLGGTHFIVLGPGQLLSAACMQQNALRKIILGLNPGDKLGLPLVQLWRDPRILLREKEELPKLFVAFCDDGTCIYKKDESERLPANLSGHSKMVKSNSRFKILDFSASSWQKIPLKHAWHKFQERIRFPQKSATEINEQYKHLTADIDTKTFTEEKLLNVHNEWLDYDFFDVTTFEQNNQWMLKHLAEWINQYGSEFFAGLTVPLGTESYEAVDYIALQKDIKNRSPKIVGLLPVHNEESIVKMCLRAMSMYTDAIVVLDDASQDNTLAIVESLAEECNIERIIAKTEWHRDEPGDRNKLLLAGREIGGTHFIVLDADEIFTANCAINDFLRSEILALQPGETLRLHWIQLWKSLRQFKTDADGKGNSKTFIFCDDGTSWYESAFIHTSRIPSGLTQKEILLPASKYGVLHFKTVSWPHVQLCQAWYKCLEQIKNPEKPAEEINQKYADLTDESDQRLFNTKSEWYEGYDFIAPTNFDRMGENKKNEIVQWLTGYGQHYFSDLNIDFDRLQI